MAKSSKKDLLRKSAASLGLYVGTYSPGDGVTRYRFIKSRGGKPVSYFAHDGIYTALGLKEAQTFLAGYRRRR